MKDGWDLSPNMLEENASLLFPRLRSRTAAVPSPSDLAGKMSPLHPPLGLG